MGCSGKSGLAYSSLPRSSGSRLLKFLVAETDPRKNPPTNNCRNWYQPHADMDKNRKIRVVIARRDQIN